MLNKQHDLKMLQQPGECGFTQEADAGGEGPTLVNFYYRKTKSHPSHAVVLAGVIVLIAHRKEIGVMASEEHFAGQNDPALSSQERKM